MSVVVRVEPSLNNVKFKNRKKKCISDVRVDKANYQRKVLIISKAF